MTPLASDPRQILLVLDPALRRALLHLAQEIMALMRSQIDLPNPPPSPPGLNRQVSASLSSASSTAPRASPSFPSSPSPAPPFATSGDNDRPTLPAPALGPGSDAPGPGPDPVPASAPAPAPAPQTPAVREVAAATSQGATPPLPPPPSELIHLRNAHAAYFNAWRSDVIAALESLLVKPPQLSGEDAARLGEESRVRRGRVFASRRRASLRDDLTSLKESGGHAPSRHDAAGATALQQLYPPLPTRLTTIPVADREEALSCVLVLLLAEGKYPAESRTLAVYLTSSLGLPLEVLDAEETEIATSLIGTAHQATTGEGQDRAVMDAEELKRMQQKKNQTSRFWKVGLASVAGAAIIGVTGGLAAPVVAGALGGLMGSIGLGGVASFLGIFWMNGALVGTLFGAWGASMTGEMVDQYAKHVDDFRFMPLRDEAEAKRENERKRDYLPADDSAAANTTTTTTTATTTATATTRRLRVTIGINGWLDNEEDVTRPWRCLGDETEVFALRYEVRSLLALGHALENLVTSYAWKAIRLEIIKRTALATLSAALWPVTLLAAASSSVDNPFNLARNRSDKAGAVLAEALAARVQGQRPVTLVGFSLGARAIHACLRELARRRAFGLVDTVVLVGAPVPSSPAHWDAMRSVVSGRLFNVYSANDHLLALVYRAASLQLGVAGLQAVAVEGAANNLRNVDLSGRVRGHLSYPRLIPKILAQCGFPVQGGEGPIEADVVQEDGDNKTKGQQVEAGDGAGSLIELGMDGLAAGEIPLPAREEGQRGEEALPVRPKRPDQDQPGESKAVSPPARPPRPRATSPSDDEESDFGGIRMVDEEDMVHMEPRPMDS